MFTEFENLKQLPFQVPLQKGMSGPAMQANFGKEILSFIGYFVCRSRFHSLLTWLRPTAETRVAFVLQNKKRSFISELKYASDSLK